MKSNFGLTNAYMKIGAMLLFSGITLIALSLLEQFSESIRIFRSVGLGLFMSGVVIYIIGRAAGILSRLLR